MSTFQSESTRNSRVKEFIPPSPTSAYSVRLARSDCDVEGAQRLRYRVFNVELGEGLESSEASGLDVDQFDSVCDHLLVEDVQTRSVIGTYRLQTGTNAAEKLGYYSEQEFDFTPFEKIRKETIELGRACIAREHRNMVVLGLLWKGIAQYAKIYGSRYLIGCSSLTSTDPLVGIAAYESLKKYQVEPRFQSSPNSGYECKGDLASPEYPPEPIKAPRLMRAYLTLGARLCGKPALDLEFKTIDFLTLLDLEKLGARALQKFLG